MELKPSSSTTSSWRARSCASCSSRPAASRSSARRATASTRSALHRRLAPGPGLPGRPDARAERLRGGAAGAVERATRAARDRLRDGLRPVRHRGVPGRTRWTTCSSRSIPSGSTRRCSGHGGESGRGRRRGRRRRRATTAAGERRWRTTISSGSSNACAERQSRRDRLAVKVGERFLLVDADDLIFASLADEVVTVAATG